MIGTVTVAFPILRRSEDKITEIVEALKSGSKQVSNAVGVAIPAELKSIWKNAG